jgi:hypothetical protein
MNYYLRKVSSLIARISVMCTKIKPQQLCFGPTVDKGEVMLPVSDKGRQNDISRRLSKLGSLHQNCSLAMG